MSAFNVKTANMHYYGGSTMSPLEWTDIISRKADKYECLDLASKLATASKGTDFFPRASSIVYSWAKRIYAKKMDAASFFVELDHVMDFSTSVQAFLCLLSKRIIAFLEVLFSERNTISICLTKASDFICVVTSDPSTDEIYMYNTHYVDFMSQSDSYVDFLVCGIDEIEYIKHDYVITKEDWDAFKGNA